MNKRETILIVDDSAINRSILARILKASYHVIQAENGADALKILERRKIPVHLIILDLNMPVMNGFELLRVFKNNRSYCAIPVIVVTADLNHDYEIRALELGATDFLKKPYEPIVIKQRILNILRFSRAVADKKIAERDSLTGIYNRDTFCKKTERLINLNKNKQYVLVCCDIERFKVINNIYGTLVGDKVLQSIAEGLKFHVNMIGTFGRLEADHFALCVPANKFDPVSLIKDIDKKIKANNLNCNIIPYFGLYPINDTKMPVSQMCDRAALAIKTIKGNYLERYTYYNHNLMDTILKEQEIITEMNEALEKGQFSIYLQPIYSLTSKNIVSAEALVRWIHPVKGLIPPDIFIPLFERNGFIAKLDDFVREEVCKYLSYVKKQDESKLFPISVNVSRMNFYNPEFTKSVVDLVEKYDISSSFLKLEITETAYNDNPKQLLEAMKRLQSCGFKILMDDFGSGYSSLNMLKDVPVDILKIDMKFINDIERSERAANVMTSVVRMAKWLDMSVVAEGVETDLQVDFLKSIGCDNAQGFYYSKPVPVDEFNEIIKISKIDDSDIDKESEVIDLDRLWLIHKDKEIFFSDMLGATGFCEMYNDAIELVRVNDAYFELTGLTPKLLFTSCRNMFDKIHSEDRDILRLKFLRAKETGDRKQVFVRMFHVSGRLMWVEMKIRFIGKKGNHLLYQFTINDITKQMVYEENKQRDLYINALSCIYDDIFEVNFTTDTYTSIIEPHICSIKETSNKGLLDGIFNIGNKFVHPSDREMFFSMLPFNNLKNFFDEKGKKFINSEIRVLNNQGDYKWVCITIIRLPSAEQDDVYLVCLADINYREGTEGKDKLGAEEILC